MTTTNETLEPPCEEVNTTLDRHHFTINRQPKHSWN